jgi:hypothetical protein
MQYPYFKDKTPVTTTTESIATETTIAPDTCSLPPKTGMCRAYFPRYYFDRTAGACKEFVYGGCQGNANNFNTKEECMQRCQPEGIGIDHFISFTLSSCRWD